MSASLTNNELKERLTDCLSLLQVPGIGNRRYARLVRAFGSPSAVLGKAISALETVSGISRSLATIVKTSVDRPLARETASRIVQLGWQVLFNGDDNYPPPLSNICDPPPLLFRLGAPFEPEEQSIGIVGTRRPSENGRSFTFRLAADLATAGITVVSGMAEGIDAQAHRGALEMGGKTIAVWGSSLDIVFPKSNQKLAERIAKEGAIYSEYLPGTRPDTTTFPQRNRIIAGLSAGVVVIEAPGRSGALITAEHALEQGRELFAVPGFPGSRMSEGTNTLLKKGARLLTSAEDIFEELPLLKGKVASRKFKQLPDLTDKERTLVDLLSGQPLQVDKLSRTAQIEVTELLGLLLALELKGIVRELSGKRYALSEDIA